MKEQLLKTKKQYTSHAIWPSQESLEEKFPTSGITCFITPIQ